MANVLAVFDISPPLKDSLTGKKAVPVPAEAEEFTSGTRSRPKPFERRIVASLEERKHALLVRNAALLSS